MTGVGEASRRGSVASAGPVRHFVTDRRRFGLSLDELVARAASAVRAGVDVIQVRERDLPDGRLADLTREVVRVSAGTPTRVVVNDRADIALAAGAAGVHLRGDSPLASRVRAMAALTAGAASAACAEPPPLERRRPGAAAPTALTAPGGFLIGQSVHSLAEVDAAVAAGGCDYLMFGTVFPSHGKPDGHPVAGLEALQAVCARSPLPVIAIGGMNESRADAVRAAGAAGFAAVGLFMC